MKTLLFVFIQFLLGGTGLGRCRCRSGSVDPERVSDRQDGHLLRGAGHQVLGPSDQLRLIPHPLLHVLPLLQTHRRKGKHRYHAASLIPQPMNSNHQSREAGITSKAKHAQSCSFSILKTLNLDVIPGTLVRRYSFRRYSRPYLVESNISFCIIVIKMN